jgi:hypothetical protein
MCYPYLTIITARFNRVFQPKEKEFFTVSMIYFRFYYYCVYIIIPDFKLLMYTIEKLNNEISSNYSLLYLVL